MSPRVCSGGRVACDSAQPRGLCAARLLFCVRIPDTTQNRSSGRVSSDVDATIQHFNESRQRSEMFRRNPIFFPSGIPRY
jgi:hypothetical protein